MYLPFNRITPRNIPNFTLLILFQPNLNFVTDHNIRVHGAKTLIPQKQPDRLVHSYQILYNGSSTQLLAGHSVIHVSVYMVSSQKGLAASHHYTI